MRTRLSLIFILFIVLKGMGQNNNYIIGDSANPGNNSIKGHGNTFVGANGAAWGQITISSGSSTPVASQNSAFGWNALRDLTDGDNNSAFGTHSLSKITGSVGNTAFGAYAARNLTSGGGNIAIGSSALSGEVSGAVSLSGSVGIGTQAGLKIVSGDRDVFLGYASAFKIINSQFNVFLGSESALNVTEGGRNVFVGNGSGLSVTNGSANVLLGSYAGPSTVGELNNRLFINNARSDTPLIYGEFSNNLLKFRSTGANGRVEITADTNKSGLRFNGLNSGFNPNSTQTSSKFLTVNADGDVVLSWVTGAAQTSDLSIYTSNSDLTGDRIMHMKGKTLTFDTAPGEDSTAVGKIYIGSDFSTTPKPHFNENYNLFVEKGILTERVKVALRNTENWADFVFEENYDLKPLSEVESFVKENKHLPGVPSAKELTEKGLDLAEMQKKQMEKIEELTLYIIEQQKQLEKQAKKIEELEGKMNK